MRAALELIVRPFVVTDVSSPKQPAPGSAATTQANTVMDIGSDEVTTWSGNYDQTVSFYYIKKPKEKKKSGDTYNPYAPGTSVTELSDPFFP